MASPLLYRKRVYLVQDGGLVTCLDADTGRSVYEQERLGAPGPYDASPLAADGRVHLCSLAGVVTVLSADDTPSVLASNPLGETTAASPAVVESVLYVRTSRHLLAFGETKRNRNNTPSRPLRHGPVRSFIIWSVARAKAWPMSAKVLAQPR